MSNPESRLVAGFRNPRPGWSNFTPTRTRPASCRRAMVVPAGNATGADAGRAHADVSASRPAHIATTAPVRFIGPPPLVGGSVARAGIAGDGGVAAEAGVAGLGDG